MEVTEKTPLKENTSYKFSLFLKSFPELFKSNRNLFFLFGIGFIETLGILSIMTGLSIYLSTVKDLSDLSTGFLIAGYGLSNFIYSIFLGSLIDKYGLKACLILGNLTALLGLVFIFLFSNVYYQAAFLLTFVSMGGAVVTPCLKLGIKVYASDQARSLGYSMLYIIFFAGGALAGIAVDIALTMGGRNTETFQKIFIGGIVMMSISSFFSMLIDDIQDEKKSDKKSWEITKEVLSDSMFWKFMLLTLLLVIIKSMFNHITITLPLYMSREIEEDAHFGMMLAVHKVIMVICIPLLTSLVYFFSCYTLLALGGVLSALAVIPLVLEASYLTVTLFVVIVSLGESLYAPRLIDYTLSIAPAGKEGTFLSIASSPLALGMIVSGLVGGGLLGAFCPVEGERHCGVMWGIIGLITLAVPVIMIVFRGFLEEKPKEVIKLV